MNDFFYGMKLFKCLVSINCRNCILLSKPWRNVNKKFSNRIMYSESLRRPSLRNFIIAYNRNFMTYTSLFIKRENDFHESKSGKASKRTEIPKVSLLDENGKETVMLFSNAEKIAKRKNCRLVKLESSRVDKIKYKLEKLLDEPKKDKNKDKKRIILREGSQPHDVEIKINHMIKFLDKGLHVFCTIEGAGNKQKQDEILQLLENSKLKDCLISRNSGKKGIHLQYAPKITEKKGEPEAEDKENAQSSS